MANQPQLSPQNQFPIEAIAESVQKPPDPYTGAASALTLTLNIAAAGDAIMKWGTNVRRRDQQLREFWPTESYLAGAVSTTAFRNSTFDWEVRGGGERVEQAVTDMLHTAIANDQVGWLPFTLKGSQDLLTQDNGRFIEPIRDPCMDAASKFKGAMAPVIGIAHLDAAQCVRTGNPEYPVLYTDRDGREHKLAWYQVIAMSDFPSASEKMNGVGYCAVTRALRLAQIMRSIAMFKDEEVGGRNIKRINLVGGVGQQQIKDAIARTHEEASNKGFSRYIEHTVLASLDPEKPVSVAEVNLASLPEGFDFDQEMQWYISGLALDFGVDYQEFAPLPGGNIGSASQSMILHRKSSGKGPRIWMDALSEAFKVYGVMPRNTELIFNDKNEQEEMEKQEVRTAALEEAAIAARSKIFPRKYIAQNLVDRGLFPDISDIPEEFWSDENDPTTRAPIGQRGGNTIREDANRTDSGRQRPRVGDRLRKLFGG
jgi:hypothetical protein